MSRSSRFLAGLSFGYVNMGASMVLGLWLTPFLLGRIGQHDYGIWLIMSQFLAYMGLMDLGVVALLPRETAYAIGRAGSAEAAVDLPEIIGRTTRVVLWQLPVVVVAACAIVYWAPSEWGSYRGPLLCALAVFVVRFPLRIFQEVLQGLQDLAFVGKLQLATLVVSTALAVGFVLMGAGLYALVLSWTASQLLPAVACVTRLALKYPFVLPRRLPPMGWTSTKRLFASGSWTTVAQLGQLLLVGSDVLVIGKLLGPAAVVPFVVTGKLVGVLANQPQLIMEVARPALSEMRTGETRDRLFTVAVALTVSMMLVSGLVACVVVVANRGFVGWWVGGNMYGGALLTCALVVSMLLRHWNTTTVYTIFCFGHERQLCLTTLVDGALNVALAVILVPTIGIVGAPIASCVSVVVVSLPWNLRTLARETGVAPAGLVAALLPWASRFVAVFAVGLMLLAVPQPTIWVVGALTAVAGATYAVVMLPLTRRAPLDLYIAPRAERLRLRLAALLRSPGAA